MTIVALLFGYWFAMTLLPVPDERRDGPAHARRRVAHDGRLVGPPAARLDALRARQPHLGQQPDVGPRRIFSTIPAIGTAMLGNLAGQWIGSKRPLTERLNGLFAVGALG